jgi:hypothetical protein
VLTGCEIRSVALSEGLNGNVSERLSRDFCAVEYRRGSKDETQKDFIGGIFSRWNFFREAAEDIRCSEICKKLNNEYWHWTWTRSFLNVQL